MVLAALLLSVFAAMAWLFGTNQGARWLITKGSGSAGITVQAASITGSVCRGLNLKDLTISLTDMSISMSEFNLRWQPIAIFAGRLSIPNLHAKNIRIQDDRAEAPSTGPPSIAWPRMSGVLSYFTINAADVLVDRMAYRRRDNPAVAIERISAEITLSHGTLELRKILVAMPRIRLEGALIAGLANPFLRTDLTITPEAPVANMDRLSLRMKLNAGRAKTIADGSMTITGLAKGLKQIELKTGLILAEKTIQLSDLRMTRPGKKGTLNGNARIDLASDGPVFHANLGLKGLDLSVEVPALGNLNGAFLIEGTLEKYSGRLSLLNKAASWQEGAIETLFQGTATEIEITSLQAFWLGGTITGSGRASWEEVVSANASLVARDLKPAIMAPGWKGVVNVDVNARFRLPKNKQPEAALSVRLNKSRLRGQNLRGEMIARLAGKELALDRFLLLGKGFALRAAGRLASGIGISGSVSDLSLFGPSFKGSAAARGKIRRSEDNLFSGTLTAHAENLATNGMKATALHLSAEVGDNEEHTLRTELSVQNISYNALHAGSLIFSASGTMKDHELQARLRSKKQTLQVKLSGGYHNGAWMGRIDDLSGTDPAGSWKAEKPARLEVSPELVSLSRLVLRSTREEYVEVESSLNRNPLSGTASLEWRNVDISRANAWLTGLSLSGSTNGSVNATLKGEKPVVTGKLSLSRAVLKRRVQNAELKAEVSRSELSVNWQGRALDVKMELVLATYGNIDGSLQVPLPARMPIALDRNGPLRGSLKGRLRENGTLSFLFPGLIQESRGQIDVDVAVAGTWKTPVVKGSLLLDKAGGYFPAAGIHLADLHLEARLGENEVRITALKARSGPGWVQGKAIIHLEAWSITTYEGTLQGDRFQALFLPQMRTLISPDIRVAGTKQKITVRGEVRVPELLIYGPPKEAAVKPSEDVIIVGQQEKTIKGGQVAMDAEVKIILGERVIVKAEGADAQLKGEVVVAAKSLDKVIARGEILVVKGKYSAYGVGLDITRGRILFAGGPMDNPSLDILALKTVKTANEVKAGVQVTGTVHKPVVKLYSQPAMPDADVLSYMVLGHALGTQDKEQSSALMKAAGALLSAGQSTALQDQVKQRLGLDVIDIQTGGGNVSRSLVTIGKYLSSKLYVSYGRALFTGENLFKLRYKFGKRLELESHSGETSGVDLYYTIQFD